MKFDLPYLDKRVKNGRTYWYFRKRGQPLIALPGAPGSSEFIERYNKLLREHAPKVHAVRRRNQTDKGSIAWIIEQFTAADALPWAKLAPSTQAKYRLIFGWLNTNYGDMLLASFNRDMIKIVRNKLKDRPSVANDTIDRLGQLWRWADENCTLSGEAKLTNDPTQGVARIATETVSAKVWPPELCSAFEGVDHAQMRTFYFLARYSGQRRGDCLKMEWSDVDAEHNAILVVQEKTKRKIWVPCHPRLRAHLDGLARSGPYILTSPRTGHILSDSTVSSTIAQICTALGFPGYSPHGLRHGAAMTMIEAGCTVDEAMAVTGHNNRSQLDRYLQEVGQRRMAERAMDKWVAADRRREALAQPNVTEFKRLA